MNDFSSTGVRNASDTALHVGLVSMWVYALIESHIILWEKVYWTPVCNLTIHFSDMQTIRIGIGKGKKLFEILSTTQSISPTGTNCSALREV